MDKDQCIRRLAKETFKTNDPDYYEFEGKSIALSKVIYN